MSRHHVKCRHPLTSRNHWEGDRVTAVTANPASFRVEKKAHEESIGIVILDPEVGGQMPSPPSPAPPNDSVSGLKRALTG